MSEFYRQEIDDVNDIFPKLSAYLQLASNSALKGAPNAKATSKSPSLLLDIKQSPPSSPISEPASPSNSRGAGGPTANSSASPSTTSSTATATTSTSTSSTTITGSKSKFRVASREKERKGNTKIPFDF